MCYLMCYRKYVSNDSQSTLNRQYLIFVLMWNLIFFLMCYLMCYRKYVSNDSQGTLNRQYLIFVLMWNLIFYLK